jgi:hypothetical protein
VEGSASAATQAQASGEAGNFRASGAGELAVADEAIPGIPGLGAANNTDWVVGETRAFIEIPAAGLYTMVVNSDDGFRLTVGTTNNPTAQVLGVFDGGRGSSDSLIYFNVTQPGVYFFRLVWMEGGGGANVEWFSVNNNGTRALVNGTQTGALRAFRRRTVSEPVPAVSNRLFAENFEGLALGPNRDEGRAGLEVWTATPPTGWVQDNTGMPGFGTANDGIITIRASGVPAVTRCPGATSTSTTRPGCCPGTCCSPARWAASTCPAGRWTPPCGRPWQTLATGAASASAGTATATPFRCGRPWPRCATRTARWCGTSARPSTSRTASATPTAWR